MAVGCLATVEIRPPGGYTILIAFVINAALSWKYFFAVPVVMAGLIAICLAIALVLAGRTPAAQRSASTDKAVPAGI